MSNTRKAKTPRPSKIARTEHRIPVEQLPKVPPADTLPFDVQRVIKAATGIDVLDPPIYADAVAASLWWVARQHDLDLTWDEARSYSLRDVEVAEDLDEALERDEKGDLVDEDPTDGSETPSNASSSR